MTTVTAQEAQAQLSRLLDRVVAGETIFIARSGTPIAQLIGVHRPVGSRTGGQWKGRVRMSADFDAPLPESVDQAFRGHVG